jgi:hypothetical protein
VFKSVLATHPEITSLDGEEEPYFILSRSGFPWTSYSDSFGIDQVTDPQFVVDQIIDEVLETDPDAIMRKRTALQFPATETWSYKELSGVARRPDRPPVADKVTYDGGERVPYRRHWRIEEPPFIFPRLERSWPTRTLLLKTPQSAYRHGLYEGLFPYARVRYIHLTRGFAATVNGLLDGWRCDWGFYTHLVGDRRWKFDLPPDADLSEDLASTSLRQWYSAHDHAMRRTDRLTIKFEDFMQKPQNSMDRITEHLGLSSHEVPRHALSAPVMSTERPRPGRWRDKMDEILPLAERQEVWSMMARLDYSMDQETWL